MLYWLVIAFTIVANSVIIYVVFRNNPNSLTNRLISYLSLISIFWTIFNYLPFTTDLDELKLLYVRSVMFVTAPFGLIIYLLSEVFPSGELKLSTLKRKIIFYVGFIGTIFASALGLSPYTFTGIESYADGSFSLDPGVGILLFATVPLGLMFLGWYKLLVKYRKSNGILRKQIQLFFIGLFLAFSLMIFTNFFLVIVFKTVAFSFLGPTFTLIFVGSIAYSIIKHRFLDISHLIARSVAYASLIILLAALYATLLLLISFVFLGQWPTSRGFISGVITAILVAFSFPWLEKRLARVTDKYLYKGWYDSDLLLYDAAVLLSSSIDTNHLTRNLLEIIICTMRISRGQIILLENNNVYQVMSENYKNGVELNQALIDELCILREPILLEEIDNINFKKEISNLQAKIVIPLRSKSQVVGILLLGDKLSGEGFNEKDLKVFNILAPEAAVAIENAESYEEIRRFNITLKEEVERATKSLVKANKELKELDQLKDEFVSIASHELRTPMVSIKNYLWMTIAGKGGKITRKQKFYLQRAYDSSNRMTKLVNDMLNISRIESGRILLNLEKINIKHLAEQIVDELSPRAKELDISVTVASKQDHPADAKNVSSLDVIADRDKISEVLVNLLSNALKFTPSGKRIKVGFDADQEEHMITVYVQDEGVGLTKEQMTKLFKKFGMIKESYQSSSEASQGTGLGLFICKSIVELHGGKIWVESEGKQKGSKFSFSVQQFDEHKLAALQKKFNKGADAGIIRSNISVK